MSKKVKPPDLEKYLNEHNRKNYTSYAAGAKMYSLKYWPFVNLVKRAKANIAFRKAVVIDMDILDSYMEQCREGYDEKEYEMARKKDEPIDVRMMRNGKKFVRLEEAAELYSVSPKTITKWARQCKAKYKMDGTVLYNTLKIDAFIETVGQNEEED